MDFKKEAEKLQSLLIDCNNVDTKHFYEFQKNGQCLDVSHIETALREAYEKGRETMKEENFALQRELANRS